MRKPLLSLLTILLLLTSPSAVIAQDPQPATQPYVLYLPITHTGPAWTPERVDTPRYFGELGSRSIVVRANSRPCIAYGNDHLYLLCQNDDSTWTFETVDPAYGVGRWASMALDSSDRIHIAYYDETNGALKYARQTGAGWEIMTADSAPVQSTQSGRAFLAASESYFQTMRDVQPFGLTSLKWGLGGYPSIDIDAGGRAHISYYDFAGQDLKYAAWTGSAWQVQTVDAAGRVGEHNSIGVNAAGTVYIAYSQAENEDIKLATKSGGAWNVSMLDSVYRSGSYVSLAIAGDGTPRVAYYVSNDGYHAVRYWDGQNGNDSHAVQSPSDEENWGHYVSLALDPSDRPWIAFHNASGQDAMVAVKGDTYWDPYTVDSRDFVGRFTALAFGPDGRPQMAYFHSSNQQLRFAWGGFDSDAKTWGFFVHALDTTTNTGIYASIDLDSHNRPAAVYLNDSQSQLMYTRWRGVWDTQVASADNDTGVQASLDLTPSDVPYVAFWQYIGGSETELRVLERNAEGWRRESAERSYNVGNYASLKAVAENNLHVSYYNQGDKKESGDCWKPGICDLHYARRDAGGWHTWVVDTAGDVGQFTSLALDSGGSPWISYYDASNGDLKLARWNGSGFTVQVVDKVGLLSPNDWLGAGTSLALDANNYPRIAYRDLINRRLKFAVWDGSSWSFSFPDPSEFVGAAPNLVLDSAGRANIAYYDYRAFDLKFAYQTPTGWTIEVIDSEGDVGSYNDLVLGADGRAHVFYYDATNGDAKYAVRKAK